MGVQLSYVCMYRKDLCVCVSMTERNSMCRMLVVYLFLYVAARLCVTFVSRKWDKVQCSLATFPPVSSEDLRSGPTQRNTQV